MGNKVFTEHEVNFVKYCKLKCDECLWCNLIRGCDIALCKLCIFVSTNILRCGSTLRVQSIWKGWIWQSGTKGLFQKLTLHLKDSRGRRRNGLVVKCEKTKFTKRSIESLWEREMESGNVTTEHLESFDFFCIKSTLTLRWMDTVLFSISLWKCKVGSYCTVWQCWAYFVATQKGWK